MPREKPPACLPVIRSGDPQHLAHALAADPVALGNAQEMIESAPPMHGVSVQQRADLVERPHQGRVPVTVHNGDASHTLAPSLIIQARIRIGIPLKSPGCLY